MAVNWIKLRKISWSGWVWTFGIALWRSNHWATETPHLNQHIQLCYHRTADNVAVTWLSGCSHPDPKLSMAARVRCSHLTVLPSGRLCPYLYGKSKRFLQYGNAVVETAKLTNEPTLACSSSFVLTFNRFASWSRTMSDQVATRARGVQISWRRRKRC